MPKRQIKIGDVWVTSSRQMRRLDFDFWLVTRLHPRWLAKWYGRRRGIELL